ncbi:radical SAM protein [Desulfococcus sp.]|uniref:radical SAM protein n=1 Tax=Desulfococcus sp. TaxID=2025834 RepID=UPI003593F7D4
MKILLIYPYCLEKRRHEEDAGVVPMGLYYIGALLRENGYDVEILNLHGMDDQPDKIREILRERAPRLIGFSILNANRWGAVEIARIAKAIDPGVTTVVGGVGATFLWEHLLTHFPEMDLAVVGEGEYPFLNLVRGVEAAEKDLREDDLPRIIGDIQGIAFRLGGKPIQTEAPAPIADLDCLPNPARYFTYRHLSLTRGCPGRCTFCGSPRLWHRKVRFHSPGYFVDQMSLLHERGVTFFYVSDDTFTLNKERAIAVCREILRRGMGISWAAISRVDTVDEELLLWMRKAGCVQISYGVESGSERIRRLLNKKITREQIQRACALTTACGIMARAYFIYGCPGETWETLRETMDLIGEIQPLAAIFYILDILPGTALYEDFKRRHNLTDDIWLKRIEDIPYYTRDPALPEELILAFGRTLRTHFHENLPGFVDAIRLKDDPELYPFHADFLSRLAMTFTHGDYAGNDAIPDPQGVAERLYHRALTYHPDHRAFLGLGILRQQQRRFSESAEILHQGVRHFPASEELHLCLAVNYMNLGQFDRAAGSLLKFPRSRQTAFYLAQCYHAMGDAENERIYQEKHQALPE